MGWFIYWHHNKHVDLFNDIKWDGSIDQNGMTEMVPKGDISTIQWWKKLGDFDKMLIYDKHVDLLNKKQWMAPNGLSRSLRISGATRQ